MKNQKTLEETECTKAEVMRAIYTTFVMDHADALAANDIGVEKIRAFKDFVAAMGRPADDASDEEVNMNIDNFVTKWFTVLQDIYMEGIKENGNKLS